MEEYCGWKQRRSKDTLHSLTAVGNTGPSHSRAGPKVRKGYNSDLDSKAFDRFDPLGVVGKINKKNGFNPSLHIGSLNLSDSLLGTTGKHRGTCHHHKPLSTCDDRNFCKGIDAGIPRSNLWIRLKEVCLIAAEHKKWSLTCSSLTTFLVGWHRGKKLHRDMTFVTGIRVLSFW